MSCGDDEQLGCNGGSAFRAWEFTMHKGIVTGGDFHSKEVDDIIKVLLKFGKFILSEYSIKLYFFVQKYIKKNIKQCIHIMHILICK